MLESDALEQLLAAARQGDHAALGRLLDAYRDRLRDNIHADIHGPMQRRIDASDIVQQTCVQAVDGFAEFRGRTLAEFWAWLDQVERNMLIDVVRHHGAAKRNAGAEQSGRQHDALARATTASQHAMRGERRRELAAAIDQLPDGQRQAVELRYLHDLKIDEIATQLGRSEEAAAGLLKRGVKAMKAILRDRSL